MAEAVKIPSKTAQEGTGAILSDTTDTDVSKAEESALREFANELAKELAKENVKTTGAAIVSKLRWYPNQAGAVVIVSRGKDRKVLATISPKSGKWSHLYPSWVPVLAELEARKRAASVSRMTHKDLETGVIP